MTTFSCTTFQGVSYYSSDGIYGDSYFSETKKKPSESGRKNIYYKGNFYQCKSKGNLENNRNEDTFVAYLRSIIGKRNR